jgi:hypothetical protein
MTKQERFWVIRIEFSTGNKRLGDVEYVFVAFRLFTIAKKALLAFMKKYGQS